MGQVTTVASYLIIYKGVWYFYRPQRGEKLQYDGLTINVN